MARRGSLVIITRRASWGEDGLDGPANFAPAAVFPDSGRALSLFARADRAQGFRAAVRLAGPAPQRGPHPFRLPPQPDDRLSPGLRRLLGLRLGPHRGGGFRAVAQPKAGPQRNADLVRSDVPAEATREQFALLRTYLDSRHAGGGMSDMGLFDYVAMVEETPVDTHIVEYRDSGIGEPGLARLRAVRRAARRAFHGLQLLPSRRDGAQPRHPHDPRSHRGGARAGFLMSISATGSRAATRWTTNPASGRWRRSARAAGPGWRVEAYRRFVGSTCPSPKFAPQISTLPRGEGKKCATPTVVAIRDGLYRNRTGKRRSIAIYPPLVGGSGRGTRAGASQLPFCAIPRLVLSPMRLPEICSANFGHSLEGRVTNARRRTLHASAAAFIGTVPAKDDQSRFTLPLRGRLCTT